MCECVCVAVPLNPRLSPAAVQCDVMKPVTAVATQSTQRHVREAGLQAHRSSQHPGMDAPSEHCNNVRTVTENDTAGYNAYNYSTAKNCQMQLAVRHYSI